MSIYPDPILFPDIEGNIIEYLRAHLSVPVSTQVPNPRPARFVRILRTGGVTTDVVRDQAMITVEAWATSSYQAVLLAQETRAWLQAMPGRVPSVSRYQEFSGPANLPDPVSGQARYTWTTAISVRGSTIQRTPID